MRTKLWLSLVVALPLTAQSVLRVGPGQTYADIPAAIAAAAPGDLVLIAAGTYSIFKLDKGLTLRPSPVSAAVMVGVNTLSAPSVVEVPIGQRAHLEHLDMRQPVVVRDPVVVGPPTGVSTAGVVSFTEVTVLGGVRVEGAALAMHRCDINGFGGHGVSLAGASTFSASQCTISASSAWFLLPAPAGIFAGDTSKVMVSDCTIEGGFIGGVHSIAALGSGITLTGAAKAWCVDSSVLAFQAPLFSPAAPGISNQSTQPITIERTSMVGSQGNAGSSVGAVQNSLVLGLAMSQPLVRGSTTQLNFGTRPGLPVIVHGSLGLGAPMIYPSIAQSDWGFQSNSITLGFLVANTQGQASLPISLPNSVWLQDLPLWFCGWSGLSLPVQLSPVVGGLVQ